jgi:hypothetical protein
MRHTILGKLASCEGLSAFSLPPHSVDETLDIATTAENTGWSSTSAALRKVGMWLGYLHHLILRDSLMVEARPLPFAF